mgnify:CR=1 FL=1|jgi:hypothetical protein
MQRNAIWFVALVSMLFAVTNVSAQWEDALAAMLSEFQDCSTPVESGNPCNTVTARAVAAVYGIDDFSAGTDGAMSIREMIAEVKSSGGWSDLGTADKQEALNAAQEAANTGRAVVAVLEEEPVGHVALILPGKLAPSGKWGAQVPNSASFFPKTPGRSYVGKTLAYAFKTKAMVRLYAK